MLKLWRSKPQEPPAPPFDIEAEKTKRRAACLAAKLEVESTQQQIREFEVRHYEPGPGGGLVHRVTTGLVSNEQIDWERAKLFQFLSRKVEAHQLALQRYAEIS